MLEFSLGLALNRVPWKPSKHGDIMVIPSGDCRGVRLTYSHRILQILRNTCMIIPSTGSYDLLVTAMSAVADMLGVCLEPGHAVLEAVER